MRGSFSVNFDVRERVEEVFNDDCRDIVFNYGGSGLTREWFPSEKGSEMKRGRRTGNRRK